MCLYFDHVTSDKMNLNVGVEREGKFYIYTTLLPSYLQRHFQNAQ